MAWIWVEDEAVGFAWKWDERDGPEEPDRRSKYAQKLPGQFVGEKVSNDGRDRIV